VPARVVLMEIPTKTEIRSKVWISFLSRTLLQIISLWDLKITQKTYSGGHFTIFNVYLTLNR
jgi:hypothetical protein